MRLTLVKTGIPHRTSEDDIHNGYYIPKGSLVFANLWWVTYIFCLPEYTICFSENRSMLHNPHLYPEPTEFRPERFLPREGKQIEQDPRTICFGFGRRLVGLNLDVMLYPYTLLFSICPGW